MIDTLDHLRRAAGEGDPGSHHRLAHALYGSGLHDEALAALGAAARSGHLGAVTELGSRLATGAGAPLAPKDGEGLLRFAADAGDTTAARHLAILAAAGSYGASPRWEEALTWTVRAAANGDAMAQAEIFALASTVREPSATVDWNELAGTIDLELWLAPVATKSLSITPEIVMLPGIGQRAVCDELIDAARSSLSAAGVTDRRTGAFKHDAARTNRFAQVKLFDYTMPLLLLRARIAAAAGQPTAHCEMMNVLCYEPGEMFHAHHDYLDPAEPGFAAELARDGQRLATVLVYLNEGYTGGETDFPNAGVRFRGATGDGLLFRNIDPAGQVDAATLHSGLPPTSGRKWVLSQWIRDRPQRQA